MGYLLSLYYKFTCKSVGEKILKIGQHLAKLRQKCNGTFFLDTVYIWNSLRTKLASPGSTGKLLVKMEEEDIVAAVIVVVNRLICGHTF